MITAEVSLYPLKQSYETEIISFIQSLKEVDGLFVVTHAMSTYVKGESSLVFGSIQSAFDKITDSSSLVLKIINRDLPVEEGFLNF